MIGVSARILKSAFIINLSMINTSTQFMNVNQTSIIGVALGDQSVVRATLPLLIHTAYTGIGRHLHCVSYPISNTSKTIVFIILDLTFSDSSFTREKELDILYITTFIVETCCLNGFCFKRPPAFHRVYYPTKSNQN